MWSTFSKVKEQFKASHTKISLYKEDSSIYSSKAREAKTPKATYGCPKIVQLTTIEKSY
jgi:hypothetical protein